MNAPLRVSEPDAGHRLGDYCDYVLSELPRADQRRWGEIYIRGLLQSDGRRSIRHIAAAVGGGCSDQSLQQFINQSPWDYGPVRQRVAASIEGIEPMAWVVDEVAFAKRGRHSAGIERQYVPARGSLMNCQVGAVTVLASEHGHVPVNWRLTIPRSWDSDPIRRARAHIPAEERHQPHWRYQIQMLDDLSGDWGVPRAPAIVNARHCTSVHLLIGELESRGVDHVVEVTGDTVSRARSAVRSSAGVPPAHGSRTNAQWTTFGQLADCIPATERTTVIWRSPNSGRSLRSQFATIPIRVSPATEMARLGGPLAEASRVLLVEWPLGGHTPRGCWLTNMADRSVAELAALTKIHPAARYELDTLVDSLGLGHHEGRSFLGWHHHVTLVSAARAFQVLTSLQSVPDAPLRAAAWPAVEP
jgi:hypothetical protein